MRQDPSPTLPSGPPRNAGLTSGAVEMRALLDAALDAVVVVDAQGCVREFNRAAERLFGYEADAALGRELADLIVPPRLREAHRRGLRAAAAGGESHLIGQRLELPALHADGHELPVEVGFCRFELDGAPAFAAFIRDLSAARQFEHDLREAEGRNRRLGEQLPLVT